MNNITRIVEYIKNHPGHIAAGFVDILPQTIEEFEAPALNPDNWEEMRDDELDEFYGYNCIPYNDQVRAYIDGDKISVEME